jgi:CubicO group peptidase (beta-lactamase class C family)
MNRHEAPKTRLMDGFPPAPQNQVTLANWQDPPFNRWSFRNVRNLLPSANIWRGDGPPAALPAAPRDLGAVAFDDREGRRMTVGDMIREGYTDGFMVLHEGKVLVERYGNGMTPDQPHLLMSVSKSLTSAAAGILAHRGVLDVERPVVDILPELAGTGYEGATLRHLLDMTVGADYSEDYEDPDCDERGLEAATGWRPQDARPGDPDTLYAHAGTVRPGGAHGTAVHYISINTDVIGWVLERLSGQPFAELFSEAVWQPMGAEFDAYVTLDKHGAPLTDGGICITLRDFARFGQLHLQGGDYNGRSIVPGEWIADFRENGDRDAWAKGDLAEDTTAIWYRSMWYLLDEDHGAYCGRGINGQMIYVDPAASVVVAKFSSHPRPLDRKLFDDMTRACQAIGRELMGG